ncbi:MAG: hypothetical protein AAF961_13430, partial [Planctomycetota bacterium]
DAIHRSLVSPRVEQIMALEGRAALLAAELVKLDGPRRVSRWHEKTASLLEDLAAADLSLDSAHSVREAMEAAGWKGSPPAEWNWPRVSANGRMTPPEAHLSATQALVAELQSYVQLLALAGAQSNDVDAVPPQYVEFVRRYLEVLARSDSD